MKYIALICARGGSKGIPGKNVKLLDNTPLIGWSIKTAKQIDRISRIIVSTDSEKIAETALKYGAEIPFIRPRKLAKDDSPEWLVWRHALDYLKEEKYKIDGLIIIPPTAPLRNAQDINNCISVFEEGDSDAIITVTDAHRNPFFNMVSVDQDGYSSLVIQQQKNIFRRQDAPSVLVMTTVAYVLKPEFIYNNNSLFEGKVRSVHIPLERALDIDTLYDFEIAEYLITKRNTEGN